MSSPLRIAVLGVGGIGSTYAFHLARDGRHEVTAIARPGSPRLAQLERDGGIVDEGGGRALVPVLETLDEETPYDLVIVTLLAHQVEAVVPALQRSAAKSIQFMFNNFEPERLRDAIGADRCSFGMPFVQAHIGDDGKLKAAIGAGGQKSLMSDPRWVEVFNGAGLPAALEPDMLLWLRCHAPMCVAFESVSIAGVRRDGGATWGESMVIARGVHEGFALIRGLGYPLYPALKTWLNRGPAWVLAIMLWSMSRIRSFRELLATGHNECRALVDVMVAAAPRAKHAVDVAKIQAMRPA
jgi:2-dehydropantoate 2-reductase